MVEKFTLTGTDNNGFRYRYSFEKKEEFKEYFLKFMETLGFDREKIFNYLFVGETYDKDGEVENQIELKVEELQDFVKHYQNKDFDIEVFFGKFRVILVIRTNKSRAIKNFLENNAKWIKPLKVEKLRNWELNSKNLLVKTK